MRHIAVFAVIGAVLAGPALATEAAEGAEWAEFSNPQEGFVMNFPGKPSIETTTFTSEYGAKLPAKVYRAQDGEGRYSLTVVDYAPLERLLTEKAKTCPRGFERCLGNLAAGAGYWKLDLMGAVVYATRLFLERDAKMTYYWQDLIGFVSGHLFQLKNSDGSQTHAMIYLFENRLYILEGTTPADDPTAILFRQGFLFTNPVARPDPKNPQFYRHPLPQAWDPAEVKKPYDVADPEVMYRKLHPEAAASQPENARPSP